MAQTLIDRTLGTIIGNFEYRPEAAFDGNIDQPYIQGAATYVAAAYIGKDWGVGVEKVVSGFKAYGSNNQGFYYAENPEVTITLQGSNDNFVSSIVDLGNVSATDANSLLIEKMSGITVSTAYQFHRLKISPTPSEWIFCAEAQFYEGEGVGGADFFQLF